MSKTRILAIVLLSVAVFWLLPFPTASGEPLGITLTPTSTEAPPTYTFTPEPTATFTPQPTATFTPQPTATSTPRPPSPPTQPAGPTVAPPTPTPMDLQPPTVTRRPVINTYITKYVESLQAKTGDTVEYTIFVYNPTTKPLTDVTVTDVLPAELDLIGATTTDGSFSYDLATRTFTVHLASLAPGKQVTIVIKAEVNSTAVPPAELTNVAILTEGTGVQHPSNPVTILIVPAGIPPMGIGPGPSDLLGAAVAGAIGLLLLVSGLRLRRVEP